MKQHLCFIASLGICLFGLNAAADAQQIKADTGGIAIGGSVTGSTVIIGIPQEKVDELVRDAKRPLEELTSQQKENIALLKEKLDLNERQVRAALGILGENDIPPERLAAKLVEIAERFKDLQATASAQPGDDPKIAALKADAQKAIDAGDLVKADALLADVETEQRRAHDRFAINEAETAARNTGSIAIGGSVTGSTVIIGIPQEKVDDLVRDAKRPLEELTTQQKENITLLKEKLDLNVRQVRAALGILGENDIPPERLAAKLVEIAERFKDLQSTASAQPGDDRKIAALKADAQKAIEAGDLSKADALLADVETEQRRSLDRLAVNAAETSARRGEIALTRLRYADAATHFANAAGAFPANSAHDDKRITYLLKEARALFQQGDELGDNDALRSAIERYSGLMGLRPSTRLPLNWAHIKNQWGVALRRLGERESGTTKLREAVVVYHQVLKEYTRERAPLDWAMTQANLGAALVRLGEREGGTARLEEAVATYREALKEQTRERVPLDWAMTQNDLGGALLTLGERESSTARLQEAVAAYRGELLTLGDRQSGTARLEEAVAAYREALKERTRERVPLDWAISFGNEGIALMLLAERRGDAAIAETALSQINTAFETMRDGGHAPNAAFYERQLPKARALVARLRGQ